MQAPLPLSHSTEWLLTENRLLLSNRQKASAKEGVITQWRKKVRWKLASYHLHITKYFAYYHILSSPPSPSLETRGIPAVLNLCLGLLKWRSIAIGFSPVFVSSDYSFWLLIFIASYFERIYPCAMQIIFIIWQPNWKLKKPNQIYSNCDFHFQVKWTSPSSCLLCYDLLYTRKTVIFHTYYLQFFARKKKGNKELDATVNSWWWWCLLLISKW